MLLQWQKVGASYMSMYRAHEWLKEDHFSRIVNFGPHPINFNWCI